MNIEDIKLYLPKYLSSDAENQLFSGLKDFPNNIDSQLYTSLLKDEKIVFQGDGIKDMLVINLPKTKIGKAQSIILSNTCDIDMNNRRNFPSQILYSPIFNLEKYHDGLIQQKIKDEKQIDNHINNIKKQRITQIFYLPEYSNILPASIVFLDRVCNIQNKFLDRNQLNTSRLFSLSNYGLYLFIYKLSIHFTRIQENVERNR
jgi:hypothetical protein